MSKAITGIAMVSAFVWACGDPAAIRIGVVTNPDGVAGAQFAAAEINRTHGIRGRPVVLRVISGGGSVQAGTALAAADTLSADNSVLAVIGHSNSSASLAGSQVYNARRVVQIAPTSSAPLLSNAGPYTFRLVASDVHQARFIAHQIGSVGTPRPAVLFVNDDYGRPLYQELRERLAAAGARIVFEAPHAEDVPLPDLGALAGAIAAANASHLVWLGRTRHLRQLMPSVRRLVPHIAVIASDGVDVRGRGADDDTLSGVRATCFVDVAAPRPKLASLQARYNARAGKPITADFALAYDAAMLIAEGARRNGLRRDGVRRFLESLTATEHAFSGATADIWFDEHGDPAPAYCLTEGTRGGMRVIGGPK